MHHRIEFAEQCKACEGTGLYVGLAEHDGAAVVCHICKGAGCHHAIVEYDDFTVRKPREDIKRVFQTSSGICTGGEDLSKFGGITYREWQQGAPFGSGTEMRNYTCPCWWGQSTGKEYSLPPRCSLLCGGRFSGCEFFSDKAACWKFVDTNNS